MACATKKKRLKFQVLWIFFWFSKKNHTDLNNLNQLESMKHFEHQEFFDPETNGNGKMKTMKLTSNTENGNDHFEINSFMMEYIQTL